MTPFTAPPSASSPRAVLRLYVIEGSASISGTLMSVGIFFFTSHRFQWGPARNFALAAMQGLVYVCGALLASRVASRLQPRRALIALHGMLALLAGIAATLLDHPPAIVALLLTHTFLIAMTWPMLEGLVSGVADPHALARRVAIYNLVWPATGFFAMAAEGTIIKFWPPSLLILTSSTHIFCAFLALGGRKGRGTPVEQLDDPSRVTTAASHPAPAPQLLRVRTMALWISRLALPATYAVVYGLMPLMPELPVMRRFDTRTQTLVGSTWLAARWLAFILLAAHPWWHTRPRVMVVAAVMMLVAFLGITLPPSTWSSAPVAGTMDVAVSIGWQWVLGLSLGVVYSGSLYFGMVLSEGSTEHGGYHEALIGLGWILGPATGALTQWLRPGDLTAGIFAVGTLIGVSVLAVGVAAIWFHRTAGAPATLN